MQLEIENFLELQIVIDSSLFSHFLKQLSSHRSTFLCHSFNEFCQNSIFPLYSARTLELTLDIHIQQTTVAQRLFIILTGTLYHDPRDRKTKTHFHANFE